MRPIVILGAGLAGLSLADALLDAGVRRPVVLVDRRRAWGRDRTWCTWQTGPLRFGELATARWWSWRTCSAGSEVIARTRRHPYIHLDSAIVYDAALDRLGRAPQVEIRTGERVLSVEATGRRPEVRTSRETFQAHAVVDAMGPHSVLLRSRPAGDVELSQRFLGWEVEVDEPVFDPATATLMDFRPADGDGLNFLYVLPFSPTRALIEHTSIGTGGPPDARRRALLSDELGDRLPVGGWRVMREERGRIPMTTFDFPVSRGAHIHAAGAAAGAIRPSSGYAFSRIQRHVTGLAGALVADRPPPPQIAPAHLTLLDRVFLAALVDRPDGGEALLWALARSVGADPFARFMTDVADGRDVARVIAALPTGAMARAALSAVASAGGVRATGPGGGS